MSSDEQPSEQHYRVLVAVEGGNGGTHEFETSAADAVAAAVYTARCLHQLDPHGRIARLHVTPTGQGR